MLELDLGTIIYKKECNRWISDESLAIIYVRGGSVSRGIFCKKKLFENNLLHIISISISFQRNSNENEGGKKLSGSRST